jgi:hypothetical protein
MHAIPYQKILKPHYHQPLFQIAYPVIQVNEVFSDNNNSNTEFKTTKSKLKRPYPFTSSTEK